MWGLAAPEGNFVIHEQFLGSTCALELPQLPTWQDGIIFVEFSRIASVCCKDVKVLIYTSCALTGALPMEVRPVRHVTRTEHG